MPDFTQAAIHQFWNDYPDPTLYKVICYMESLEDWTIDGDEKLETSVQKLGNALEDIGNIDLQLEDDLIDLFASVKTGRGLRILMCLDTAYPGAAAKILMRAEEMAEKETDSASIFLRRNVVFERLRLLGRVFAPDRLKLVVKALENIND